MTLSALRERTAQWFDRSNNRRILAAALIVGGMSVVVKLTAMAKELMVAYRFGTGDEVDAFLMAFVLPALLINVVTGSISAAFAPVYVDVREKKGRSDAVELMSSAAAGSAALVLGVSCALVLGTPLLQLLATGFGAAKLQLTRALFLILLPILALNVFVALWSATLNCEGQFAVAALAPVSVPLLILCMILVTARSWGVYSLAIGTVLGYALQCGLLAIALRKTKIPISPRWHGMTPDLKRILRQYMPLMASAILTSGSWAIGQAMAASLPAGSVAALNYGNKIPAVVTEITSLAIATAVLPHFSLMVARREWLAIRHTVWAYGRLMAVVTIPLTLIGIWLSPTVIHLLFERGAFSSTDTRTVAAVQSLYLLQVPFVMIGMLFVRLASSLRRNEIFVLGAAITLPLNIGMNAWFMRSFGVAGIALATSVVYLVSCTYLFIAVGRAMRAIERTTPHTQ